MTARRIVLLALAPVLALSFAACGRNSPPLERAEAVVPSTTTTTAPPDPVFVVAHVTGKSIPVFDSAGATTPVRTLNNPNDDGAPRVFLVKSVQQDWLNVMVPIRPNGSEGWIRTADVTLTQHDWRALVELGAHRLTVWHGPQIFLQKSVGVGTGGTPTPTGDFYITELLQPDNPNGPYGPYAFGLSAFSNVLYSFAGGPGEVGLHGTNESGSFGRDVSHGCIRVDNASITQLAQNMPIGTPIKIVP